MNDRSQTGTSGSSGPAGPPSPARLGLPSWTRYLLAGVALLIVGALLALKAGSGPLTVPKAVILGAVEGITEYLPVSSTGHLLVTERILDLGSGTSKQAADTFAVSVQLGAILAVVALYWGRLMQMLNGVRGRDDEGRQLLGRLIIAFIPAAIVGAALDHTIKDHLFATWPVVVAWIVGGVFLLWWKPKPGGGAITTITIRSAAVIGCAQVLALWPGTSRSLVTIVAALAVGLAMDAALEFSFLLGLATLTAATVLDLAKDGHTLVRDYGYVTPLLGGLVAFVTAVVAVRFLVSYLRTRPLSDFGWYRLGVAALVIVLVATNVI